MTPRRGSTIARLPENAARETPAIVTDDRREKEILEFIKKGGRSAREEQRDLDEGPSQRRISVRLQEDILARVRCAVRVRPIKTSSNTWVTEAILEKLKRESF